jgi:hypothetical protein
MEIHPTTNSDHRLTVCKDILNRELQAKGEWGEMSIGLHVSVHAGKPGGIRCSGERTGQCCIRTSKSILKGSATGKIRELPEIVYITRRSE